jgi:hypothetical protein
LGLIGAPLTHLSIQVRLTGTEVDLHTPHWHGNTVDVNAMRMDVLNLLPASMIVADMVPDDVGTWLLHCHVNDHIRGGNVDALPGRPVGSQRGLRATAGSVSSDVRCRIWTQWGRTRAGQRVVETKGLEPSTPALQRQCSAS